MNSDYSIVMSGCSDDWLSLLTVELLYCFFYGFLSPKIMNRLFTRLVIFGGKTLVETVKTIGEILS